ncbi:hypothetical protein DWX51_01275 [Bacteroides uniformis]|uniref:Uncharacterized protein n=1 Tax=Bacteroides uniformis TaxID=820 RepID=A0A396F123_BACUN|nr:hypothetical protein EYA81_03440 [Bacteroides sp. A1C1]RGJ53772.1 hypothetical protein DXD58_02255 [Bacteroides sp. D20]RGN88055.1 hypothetical protein DXB37_20985 [Bacteroides uniformis]RJV31663.1 hypothetical protein DWY41_03620 [Bacteroides sp. AF25-17LB]RJV32016.1 hypothetical protein DWY57_02725 [Bacteroides sp. AF25-5LB]
MSSCSLCFPATNIKEGHGQKKYPGQTTRICDEQPTTCDEWRISVTNSYRFILFSISAFTSLA